MGILSALLLLAPLTFDRGEWHPRWLDLDGDCQSTRQEVLIAQSQEVMLTPDGCHVEVGRWKDPYSGATLYLPSEIDVDHILSLKWVHDRGGSEWDKERREQFANDMDNLVATHRSLNRSKGSRGPDQWLPPNEGAWCWYGATFTRLSWKWSIELTATDRQAIAELLAHCAIERTDK
jgi:hypothetical protein